MMAVTVDLRELLEPTRDQGRRPTCLAFAASAVHRLAHGHPSELCPEWLYFHATRRDGLPANQGSTIEATCEILLDKGQPDEQFWPYQGSNANPQPYHPPIGTPPVVRSPSGARKADADRWRQELDSGCPLVITLSISPAFYGPASFIGPEAVIADDHAPIDPALLHALVLAGYGNLKGVPHFLVRNSWGLTWGWAGFAWLPQSYLIHRFAGAFVIHKGASNDVQPDDTRAHSRLRVG